MGVPKFFRWLTERFPQINRRISEGRKAEDYVDNFYLDMNGIIHTCTHGDAIRPGESLSEEEMIRRIFEYTERLIRIAKPRKLCYLAIDGVAPRAKMNQQRSRRYRAPREAAQQAAIKARDGGGPKSLNDAPPFDSNCITPGTEFLYMLGEKYKEWIVRRQSEIGEPDNPFHSDLTVRTCTRTCAQRPRRAWRCPPRSATVRLTGTPLGSHRDASGRVQRRRRCRRG